MVLGSRHASGDVSKDEIVPAIERDEAIGCSEVDAYFPLILADLIADVRKIFGLATLMAVSFC